MAKRKTDLQWLLQKYKGALGLIPDSVAVFDGFEPKKAARLATETVIEQVIDDLKELIAQEP